MPIHRELPDAELHEPKGVVSAPANSVYRANGSGSGVWEVQSAGTVNVVDSGNYYDATTVEAVLAEIAARSSSGWVQYDDTVNTGGTSLTIAATPGTALTNNRGLSNQTQAPRELVNPLWNSSTNRFVPIRLNDFYTIQASFTVSALTATVDYASLILDTGDSSPVLWQQTFVPRIVGERVSLTIPVAASATIVANGGRLRLLKSGSGTMSIQNFSLVIERTHRGR